MPTQADSVAYQPLNARVESFSRARVRNKEGYVSTRVAYAQWPHTAPSAEDMAAAGFFYAPKRQMPDNTKCFSCEVQIGGWEATDDPAEVHMQLSEHCRWAHMGQGRLWAAEHKHASLRGTPFDPHLDGHCRTRLATFGNWPHENKRGWRPTPTALARAGFFYAPAFHGDDGVQCALCDITLNDWERSDDPLAEHERQRPDCLFFTSIPSPTGSAADASEFSVAGDAAGEAAGDADISQSGFFDDTNNDTLAPKSLLATPLPAAAASPPAAGDLHVVPGSITSITSMLDEDSRANITPPNQVIRSKYDDSFVLDANTRASMRASRRASATNIGGNLSRVGEANAATREPKSGAESGSRSGRKISERSITRISLRAVHAAAHGTPFPTSKLGGGTSTSTSMPPPPPPIALLRPPPADAEDDSLVDATAELYVDETALEVPGVRDTSSDAGLLRLFPNVTPRRTPGRSGGVNETPAPARASITAPNPLVLKRPSADESAEDTDSTARLDVSDAGNASKNSTVQELKRQRSSGKNSMSEVDALVDADQHMPDASTADASTAAASTSHSSSRRSLDDASITEAEVSTPVPDPETPSASDASAERPASEGPQPRTLFSGLRGFGPLVRDILSSPLRRAPRDELTRPSVASNALVGLGIALSEPAQAAMAGNLSNSVVVTGKASMGNAGVANTSSADTVNTSAASASDTSGAPPTSVPAAAASILPSPTRSGVYGGPRSSDVSAVSTNASSAGTSGTMYYTALDALDSSVLAAAAQLGSGHALGSVPGGNAHDATRGSTSTPAVSQRASLARGAVAPVQALGALPALSPIASAATGPTDLPSVSAVELTNVSVVELTDVSDASAASESEAVTPTLPTTAVGAPPLPPRPVKAREPVVLSLASRAELLAEFSLELPDEELAQLRASEGLPADAWLQLLAKGAEAHCLQITERMAAHLEEQRRRALEAVARLFA